jgi:hypothetical protein
MISPRPDLDRLYIFLICLANFPRYLFSQQLTDQNVSQAALGVDRHIVAYFGYPHENSSVAHADSVIYTDVRIKTDVYLGFGSIWIEASKNFGVDLGDNVESRVIAIVGHG